jgi:hypothetical protein
VNMVRQIYSLLKACDIRTVNVAFIHTVPNITIPQNLGNSCVFFRVFSLSALTNNVLTNVVSQGTGGRILLKTERSFINGSVGTLKK